MSGLSDAGRAYLRAHAIDEVVLARYGVTERGGRLHYPNGRSISLNGREPKALQPKGQPLRLWWPEGPPEDGATVLVCEGESDALAALSASDPGARLKVVAVPGTGYTASKLADDLRGVGVAILAFDGDDAGRKATVRAAAALERAGIAAHDLAVPDGRDVADCLAALDPNLRVPWLKGQLSDARPVAQADRQEAEARPGPAVPVPATGDLLIEIGKFIRRFVILPSPAEYRAVALFVLHTWAFDAAHATPYIVVESPEKQSGKTRLLEVLELVCRGAVKVASISAAGLFQTIGNGSPTLLIDEADAVFSGNSERCEDLRGVLNAGNAPGSKVIRGGRDGKPVAYDVYSPKVIAGIATGRLPDTIRDRAIVVPIDRKLRTERVQRLRRRTLREPLDALRGQLGAWAVENREALYTYDLPEPIESISDRLEEAWEPLLAIAELAGGEWPQEARRAAEGLASGDVEDGDTASHALLVALRAVFGDREAMSTREILAALNEDEQLPFGVWNDGKGMTARELGRLLKRYRVRPQKVKLAGRALQGYRRNAFANAWTRYAPSTNGTSGTSHTQSQKLGFSIRNLEGEGSGYGEAANPHSRAKVPGVPGNGHPTWTEDEIERLVAKHEGGS